MYVHSSVACSHFTLSWWLIKLIDICYANISTIYVQCFFIFLNWNSTFISCLWFWHHTQEIIAKSEVLKFSFMFSSKSLIVLAGSLGLWSVLIQFFICCMWSVPFHSFACRYSVSPVFSHWTLLSPVENNLNTYAKVYV